MSMFLCAKCDEMADSDEGCEAVGSKGIDLICIDCMNESEEDEETYDTARTPAEVTAQVHRTRASMGGKMGYSYDEIYNTLVKSGCPEDIAAELAREKSR